MRELAESRDAAVRAARAETWAEARDKFAAGAKVLNKDGAGFARALLVAANEDAAHYCDERATAAREGQ